MCCDIRTLPPAGVYKNTVNLPDTAFNMRANSAQREPQLQVGTSSCYVHAQALCTCTAACNCIGARCSVLMPGPLAAARQAAHVFAGAAALCALLGKVRNAADPPSPYQPQLMIQP